MPTETEAKFKVTSHDPIRERLQSLGGSLIENVIETNRILDRPDGYLRKQGCGLRIRSTLNKDTQVTRGTMTYKGPCQPGDIKIREEVEIEVSDAEMTAKILNQMGYIEILWYEKSRESWRLGEARIELDQPPHVGLFVEIEASDEESVRRIQADIGLGHEKPTPATYVQLLLEYAQQQGLVHPRIPLA